MKKFTVHQFNQMFPDEEACLEKVLGMVYPDGINCRKCQAVTRHHRLSGRKAYSCQDCGTQVYPLAGTIFEKSSTPLKSWFYAMYLMASTRTGISAKQLEREASPIKRHGGCSSKAIHTGRGCLPGEIIRRG